MKQLRVLFAFLGVLCILMLNGCNGDGGGGGVGGGGGGNSGSTSSSSKEITSYMVNNIPATIKGQNISVILPYGTDLTTTNVALTTTGASVSFGGSIHKAGALVTPVNFSENPSQTITVTAEDGSTNVYTATVIVASKAAKEIIAFSLNGIDANVIDEAAKTISVILPYGTSLENLEAKFVTTGVKVTVNGVEQKAEGQLVTHFATGEALYVVTSAKGDTQTYTVKVSIASNTATAITALSVDGIDGEINEEAKTISVILPFGTDRTYLRVNVTTAGKTIFANGLEQAMEAYVTYFNTDQIIPYKVVAYDGQTSQTYSVRVTEALNPDAKITKFSLNGIAADTIDESSKTIHVTLPHSYPRNELMVEFDTAGDVTVDGKDVISGEMVSHFATADSALYKVTSKDKKNTQTYTVNVRSRDMTVTCWGQNQYGQSSPPPLTDTKTLSLGFDHACALDGSSVKCWGYNYYGQTTVPALTNPKMIAAGGTYTCALDDNGVKCWGSSSSGQLEVPPLKNPKMITAGFSHTCALDDDGVKCWGNNSSGQLEVPPLKNPKMISAQFKQTCALDDDGGKCWGNKGPGDYDYGQDIVPSLTNPKMIAAGGSDTCTLDDNGVKCWGWNYYGQDNVPLLTNPSMVSTSGAHTCALDDNGVKCWGWNYFGQSTVPALINPSMVSTSKGGNTCAISEK